MQLSLEKMCQNQDLIYKNILCQSATTSNVQSSQNQSITAQSSGVKCGENILQGIVLINMSDRVVFKLRISLWKDNFKF